MLKTFSTSEQQTRKDYSWSTYLKAGLVFATATAGYFWMKGSEWIWRSRSEDETTNLQSDESHSLIRVEQTIVSGQDNSLATNTLAESLIKPESWMPILASPNSVEFNELSLTSTKTEPLSNDDLMPAQVSIGRKLLSMPAFIEGQQFPASIDITTLNGKNGFIITGFSVNALGGFSVSNAGDVNKDGITDLIIGSSKTNDNTGAGYVVFGHPEIGSSGTLNVTSLNGNNGFMITGFSMGVAERTSVSHAGDVNKDGITDLLIGAFKPNDGAGTSYIVFGHPEIGNSGFLDIANLTGANGFSVRWLQDNSYGSLFYNVGIGDVNNDRVDDFMIGIPTNSHGIGSYVVFGNPGIGSSGTFDVAYLNGANGFNMVGLLANDGIAFSVTSAGDVNGDNITDFMIGAPFCAAAAPYYYNGCSYVLFGNYDIGSSGALDVRDLNGINGFTITGFPVNSLGG